MPCWPQPSPSPGRYAHWPAHPLPEPPSPPSQNQLTLAGATALGTSAPCPTLLLALAQEFQHCCRGGGGGWFPALVLVALHRCCPAVSARHPSADCALRVRNPWCPIANRQEIHQKVPSAHLCCIPASLKLANSKHAGVAEGRRQPCAEGRVT